MKNRLKEERMKRKIKAVDLAKALNVTKQTLSHWETNKRNPDLETLCKLADLYGCTVDHLIGREEKYSEIDQINNLIATMPADKYKSILMMPEMIK